MLMDITQIPRVTPYDVQEKRRDQLENVVFVDARMMDNWNASGEKIPGAKRVPPFEVEQHLNEIPINHPVVVYATDRNEAISASVAQILLSKGWNEVYVLDGGFQAWQDAGLPV